MTDKPVSIHSYVEIDPSLPEAEQSKQIVDFLSGGKVPEDSDKQKALQSLQTLGQEADSMEVKPLPCPFCGGEPEFRTGELDDFGDQDVFLYCDARECYMQPEAETYIKHNGKQVREYGEAQKILLKKWNTRA